MDKQMDRQMEVIALLPVLTWSVITALNLGVTTEQYTAQQISYIYSHGTTMELLLHYYNRFMARSILSGTTQVSRYQKNKTKNQSEFTGAKDSEWQWHQQGHMQICTLTQTHNNTSTPPLSFLQAGCPFCCPTNSVKALKAWDN